MEKTPPGDFKVITLENSLLSQQVVTSKGISVPYTNLQLNPYPNTQLDLFYSDNLSFSMHGSQYVTNQLRGSQYATSITNQRKMLTAKFFSSSHDKDHEVAWSQNPMVYKYSSFFTRKMNQGKFCLQSQFALTKLCFTLVQFVSTLTATKIILIYVQVCEKRKPKHIIMDWMKNRLENLSFINLDRYLSVELLSSHRIQIALSLDRCQLSSFNE